jgi:hypothetical protein
MDKKRKDSESKQLFPLNDKRTESNREWDGEGER